MLVMKSRRLILVGFVPVYLKFATHGLYQKLHQMHFKFVSVTGTSTSTHQTVTQADVYHGQMLRIPAVGVGQFNNTSPSVICTRVMAFQSGQNCYNKFCMLKTNFESSVPIMHAQIMDNMVLYYSCSDNNLCMLKTIFECSNDNYF